jgi:hypothetical protein
MQFPTEGRVSLFLVHFTKWISNVCHYKKKLISFQNWFGILSQLSQPQGSRCFLIWYDSAGNITLFQRQHVARSLRVEWAWSPLYTLFSIVTAALSMLSQFSVANIYIYIYIYGVCRAWNCFSSSHKLVTQAKHTSWFWPL